MFVRHEGSNIHSFDTSYAQKMAGRFGMCGSLQVATQLHPGVSFRKVLVVMYSTDSSRQKP